ncbi:hypothetical protein LXL04_005001 [Taraxacum kok-saghyz]
MTTRNSGHHHRPKFLYLEALVADQRISSNDEDNSETIKFDIWNSNNDYLIIYPENPISKSMVKSIKPPLNSHRSQKRTLPVTGKSSPVDVPDWPKILRDAYKQSDSNHVDDDDSCGACDDDWLPPHEYLARIGSASLSVHEGVGRRLKGRDLSRLRNAIWKETGFDQD